MDVDWVLQRRRSSHPSAEDLDMRVFVFVFWIEKRVSDQDINVG